MTDKNLGVRLTADESDLLRGFTAGSAGSAQFAATVENSLGRASSAAERMGAASGQMSASVSGASAGAQAYSQAGSRFVSALERQVQAIGKTKSELLELRAAELGVSAQAAPLISRLTAQETALNAGGKALNQYGMSAAQTAAAMRGVPAQITDIVVSLQAGQSPMTVALQQGGQLKDMFGGIVPAARALASSLLGLINPYTLTAAAAVALGAAVYQGSQETGRFNRAIQMSGNYAGVTAGSMREMASAAALIGRGSLGNARQAVESLVATGQISKETIESLSATMVEMSRVSGESMDDISKDYARMPDGVLKWAEEHNRSMNFMTLAQWDYIRALEETGNREAAMQATSEALHSYLGSQAAQNVGILERAWKGLKSAISSTWEAMKSFGRDDTTAEILAQAQKEVRERQNIVNAIAQQGIEVPASEKAALASAQMRLELIKQQEQTQEAVARAQSLAASRESAGINAAKELDALDRAASKTRQLNEALAENARNEAAIRALNPDDDRITPKAIADREKNTRKKFEDRDAGSAGQNAISAQLAAMQSQARLREEQLRQENARLEAERAKGLLSEEQFIRRKAEAQRAALQDELQVAQRQAEVAGGKKSLAERERYLGRVKQIEAQIARSHEQEAADIEKYQEKIRGALRATQLDMENYRQTRDLQVSRQLGAMTLGENDRGLVDAINQAQDRYRRIRDGFTDKMLREGGAGALNSEQYLQGIAEIDRAMQEQVVREQGYMQQRLVIQSNWRNGATLALNQWRDSSANIMAQAQQVFSNAFSGMENALVSFVMTGKASFKEFATSVIADLARIAARQAVVGIAGSLVGALAGGFSSATIGGSMTGDVSGMAAAGGGSWGSGAAVMHAKGAAYAQSGLSAYTNGIYNTPQVFAFAKGVGVFGEAGPEAIMPLKRGPDGSLGVRAEVPNWAGQSSGAIGGDITINTEIHLADGGASTQTQTGGQGDAAQQLGDLVANQTRAVIAREMRPGGLIYNFRTSR